MRLQIRTVVIAVNKHASTCAQWGTVLSALGTLAALGVAYEAFGVQNAQLKEQIKTQAQATAEERERFLRQLEIQRKHLDQFVVAFQNQQSAALYTQANTTTRFLQDHPRSMTTSKGDRLLSSRRRTTPTWSRRGSKRPARMSKPSF
jgi:hypothetical protein